MSQAGDSPSPSDTRLAKLALRSQVRLAKRGISTDGKTAQSRGVCQRVVDSELWCRSRRVLLYAHLPSELDINLLITNALAKKKTVAFPRYDSKTQRYAMSTIQDYDELVSSAFGVKEPAVSCAKIQPNQLDLAIVPGVAFDVLGRRLGRGGGHYDRLLQRLKAAMCGVCFREQVLPQVPEEAHDIRMDLVATPDEWLVGDPN
jgi:5-formyltetrahydrofolate cyclo-ligase